MATFNGFTSALPLRAGGLRVRTRRTCGQLAALHENRSQCLRDRRGIGELQRHDLHHHILGHRHRVHHRHHCAERLQVVRRGRNYQPVRPALPGDRVCRNLDRLAQVQKHALAGLVLNLQATYLLLQFARLARQLALRTRTQQALQDARKLRRVRLLQRHHQHLRLRELARRIELANHLLDLRQHRIASHHQQAARTRIDGDRQRLARPRHAQLRDHLLHERENFLRRRVCQRHHAKLDLRHLSGGVELIDECFEKWKIRRAGAHNDAPRARLGDDGDLGLLSSHLRWLSRLALHRHGFLSQQFGQGSCRDHRVRVLQREKAELRFVPPKVERQVRDDAIQVVEFLRRAGKNQRVRHLVHRDDHFRHCVGVRCRLRAGLSRRSRRNGSRRSGRLIRLLPLRSYRSTGNAGGRGRFGAVVFSTTRTCPLPICG